MKKLLLFLTMALSMLSAFAQDVIVKNDGSTVLCKVIGVNNNEVIYTKWSDVNGPQYIMDRTLVANINYMDGRQEKLSEQTSNVYAPGIQQTGDSNYNDNALLALDGARYNNQYTRKAKQLTLIGCCVGIPLCIGGTILTTLGGLWELGDDGLPSFVTGVIMFAGGVATLTGCLIKAHQYKKQTQLLTSAPVFQHEFNFKDGSNLCAGVDMIRDKRTKQTTFGLGLQYNF